MDDARARALAELIPAMQQYLLLGEAIAASLHQQGLPFSLPQAAARSVLGGLVRIASEEITKRAPEAVEGVAKRLTGLSTPKREAA